MKLLSRTTLCVKLMGTFGVLLTLVLGLSYCALTAIRGLGGSLDSAVNSTAKKLQITADIRAGVSQMRLRAALAEISLINANFVHSVNDGGTETVCGDCHTADRVVANRQGFEELSGQTDQKAAQLESMASSDGERKALAMLRSGVASWARMYQQYLALAEQKSFSKAHDIMVGEIYPLVQTLDASVDALTVAQAKL